MEDMSDLAPSQGSYPLQFSWDDLRSVAYNTLVVSTIASLQYIGTYVLPEIRTTEPTALTLLTLLTAGLHTVLAYLSDTRPKSDKARVSYREYRRIRAIRSL